MRLHRALIDNHFHKLYNEVLHLTVSSNTPGAVYSSPITAQFPDKNKVFHIRKGD
jgi:hypothetical protein